MSKPHQATGAACHVAPFPSDKRSFRPDIALERHGHAARVDHRSFEAQGIDREPTQHLSSLRPAACAPSACVGQPTWLSAPFGLGLRLSQVLLPPYGLRPARPAALLSATLAALLFLGPRLTQPLIVFIAAARPTARALPLLRNERAISSNSGRLCHACYLFLFILRLRGLRPCFWFWLAACGLRASLLLSRMCVTKCIKNKGYMRARARGYHLAHAPYSLTACAPSASACVGQPTWLSAPFGLGLRLSQVLLPPYGLRPARPAALRCRAFGPFAACGLCLPRKRGAFRRVKQKPASPPGKPGTYPRKRGPSWFSRDTSANLCGWIARSPRGRVAGEACTRL